ncbi:MAG: T9SS type A sorting domain-containing protein [Bacteroidota bacterium]
MKKLLLIALVLTGLTAKAQYFHHIYGSTNDDYSTAGVNITPLNPLPLGHFQAGITFTCLPVNAAIATYNDMNGNVAGAPFFENNYLFTSPAGNLVSPQGGTQVMALTTCGPVLGLSGHFIDPAVPSGANDGVYYMQVNAGGAPGPVFTYLPPPGFTVVSMGGVSQSQFFPGDWFLCGTVVDGAATRRAFALRINECTGALVWGVIYDILAPVTQTTARDIAENPVPAFGTLSAAIVGEILNAGNQDGFLIHIDGGTGVPIGFPVIVYGFPTTNDALWSIEPAAQCPNFPPGFVLGGHTDINGNQDFLVVRMDPVIAPLFTNAFDYSLIPGSDNRCYDAIQRINSACQCEYYSAGNVQNGVFGGFDIMVVKMDMNGNTLPGDEFNYGGAGNDFGAKLDQRNLVQCGPPLPNFDGLSMYSSWGSAPNIGGNSDLMNIKAYYNGVSTVGGCNEKLANPILLPGVPPMPQMPVVPFANFTTVGNIGAFSVPIQDLTLCFAPIIGGGNNARIAPLNTNKETDAMLVMPNPAQTGTKAVSVEYESTDAGTVDVAIYDMLGRQYYNGKAEVVKGKNKLPIDMSTTNMSAGTYSVRVTKNGETKTILLMVE